MFVYERANEKWISTLKSQRKPMPDGLEPSDYWYFDREKNIAVYYIGYVSDGILRCSGEAQYDFGFIYNDEFIHVTTYIFPRYSSAPPLKNNIWLWDDKNRLQYSGHNNIDSQQLNEYIKEAILYYLNNIRHDRDMV